MLPYSVVVMSLVNIYPRHQNYAIMNLVKDFTFGKRRHFRNGNNRCIYF